LVPQDRFVIGPTHRPGQQLFDVPQQVIVRRKPKGE